MRIADANETVVVDIPAALYAPMSVQRIWEGFAAGHRAAAQSIAEMIHLAASG